MGTGRTGWIEAAALAASAALAGAQTQPAGAQPAAPSRITDLLLGTPGLVVIAAVVIVAIALFVLNRSRNSNWETVYSEPEPRNSKFEMLNAEIQGLTLRVSSGESKGYYRKVETLGRVLLERMGYPGARKMTAEQINEILQGGRLNQNFAARLGDIFERCRKGAVHETDKVDFSASELLKELSLLVNQVEETPQNKEA
ncbi:hypothetical protein LLG95_09055 [bacterium]|nr:hypothetical protein [bacterium]